MGDKGKNLGKRFKKAIFTVAGAGVMGLSLDLFLVPLHIAAGGVSGLATVVSHLTGWGVGLLILLINIPIFVLGFRSFDAGFLGYALLGTAALSLFTQAFAWVPALTGDLLLAAVLGGAGLGLGLGMALQVGGTTGGTDILAMVFRKRFPAVSAGQVFLVIDGLVILAAGLAFKEWEIILYSVLALFVSTKVLDALLAGVDYAEMVYIISDTPQAIAREIYARMNRGVTGLDSVSMYTGKARQVLLCVIRKAELPRLKRLVRYVDREAFLVVSGAREVLGNGFKEI